MIVQSRGNIYQRNLFLGTGHQVKITMGNSIQQKKQWMKTKHGKMNEAEMNSIE